MFERIGITDIPGFTIGNADDKRAATGCTVIICEQGAFAGVDVRGGGPATRETDLLKPESTVEKINAVMISGGSAYGLEASSGVMNDLERKEIGYRMGDIIVPIVCQASLYDLALVRSDIRPDKLMGMKAVENAYKKNKFSTGNAGAGMGCTVGKIYGMERAMKSGLGSFACRSGDLVLGALTAVNALGDVYDASGKLLAGALDPERKYIQGTISELKNRLGAGDGSIEAPDAGSDEYDKIIPDESRDIDSTFQSDTIVLDADTINAALQEFESSAAAEPETDKSSEDGFDDSVYEIDYGISNTTISCFITNAKMTKTECNRLASILHDGYARAIKPVHTNLDGDTIFVMTTAEVDVDFDAFSAVATDMIQYSIIDAVLQADDDYDLYSAKHFRKQG